MAQNNKINGGILYFWRRKMKKKMQPKIKGDFLLAAAISFLCLRSAWSHAFLRDHYILGILVCYLMVIEFLVD